MYEVTFGLPDRKTVKFEKISKIEYGRTSQDVSAISGEEILTKSFKLTGFFHLVGEKINVKYHDSSTTYVEIKEV